MLVSLRTFGDRIFSSCSGSIYFIRKDMTFSSSMSEHFDHHRGRLSPKDAQKYPRCVSS